ncbi:hypothetical protein [Roseovarius pacificus]|uniref:hypothetical protein n=1 Tax=Roseovarius pacificus TaxID=337701 RepID=UPI0009333988|nr:hypothetical protein [Roseovarius pacificus]
MELLITYLLQFAGNPKASFFAMQSPQFGHLSGKPPEKKAVLPWVELRGTKAGRFPRELHFI